MQTINETKVVVHKKKMKQIESAVKKILLFPNFFASHFARFDKSPFKKETKK